MKTFIILLYVSKERPDVREKAESIENFTFNNYEELQEVLKDYGFIGYDLSDFMDLCNNEEFEVDEYFISYVHINN
jgi:hypothetical protein